MPTQTVAPGITRFDFDDRQGYMVRICRQGNQTNEYFSDKKHGGKRKALLAAKARYDELFQELGPVQNPTKDLLTHRNTTGKVGVHVAYTADNRWPNCEYMAYCASWKTAEGKREKINFAWNKYGQDEAWELACIARDHELKDRDKVVAMRERQLAKSQSKKGSAKSAAGKAVSKKAGSKKAVSKKAVSKKAVSKKSLSVKAATKKKTAKKPVKKAKRAARV